MADKRRRRHSSSAPAPGADARRLAIEAARRIEDEGAYANLLVPKLLEASDLDQRDRNLVTELVYGSTRMRRALDWLVDRFLVSDPPPALRAALRIGAYQLAFTRIPPHAAVSATVDAAAKRNRGVVNAVLRKVAADLPPDWPSEGVRRSYPDWLVDRLADDRGARDTAEMLDRMNEAPTVHERADGYVQDLASLWVVAEVEVESGHVVFDMCAAPGGKATALAEAGAHVVAADARHARAGLVRDNARRLDRTTVDVVTADGLAPPVRPGAFDRVLVDAPCSGIGVLRRRPDARWRLDEADVERLAGLQRRLLSEAADLVAPGGMLVYSVCTVTDAETVDVAASLAERGDLVPVAPIGQHWRPHGRGGLVLPQDHDTDGMAVFRWRREPEIEPS